MIVPSPSAPPKGSIEFMRSFAPWWKTVPLGASWSIGQEPEPSRSPYWRMVLDRLIPVSSFQPLTGDQRSGLTPPPTPAAMNTSPFPR